MKESKRIERRVAKYKKENPLLFLNIKAKSGFLKFEGNAVQAHRFVEDMDKNKGLYKLGYLCKFILIIELELEKHGVYDSMGQLKDEYKEQIESLRK